MKKYLPIVATLLLIIPSVAFASWWNPLSWNWSALFDSPSSLQVQTISTTTSSDNFTSTSTSTPLQQPTLFPQQGTIVHPGDEIAVHLLLPKNFPKQTIFFTIPTPNGPELRGLDSTQDISFLWKVPDRLGKLDILTGIIPSVNTYVISKPKSALGFVVTDPTELSFDHPGQTSSFIKVKGHYKDGTEYYISGSDTGTIYSTQSGSNKVVSVDSTGYITAVGNGQDSLIISNTGVSTGIPVTVKITNSYPKFINIATTTVEIGTVKEIEVTAFIDPFGNNLSTTLATINPAPCHSSKECSFESNYKGSVDVTDHGQGNISIKLKPSLQDVGEFDVIIQTQDDGDPNLGAVGSFRLIVTM